jgi:predicted MFS family arabinose efflux permease
MASQSFRVNAHTIYLKLLLLASLIAAFTAGMSYLLISFKIENTHRELRHGRFDLISQDIDRIVEQSLTLGLDFRQIPTLPAALKSRLDADGALRGIDVLDKDGIVLYSTDTQRLRQSAIAEWLAAMNAASSAIASPKAGPAVWRVSAKDSTGESVAGTNILNSFGQQIGFVAVRYSAREGAQAIQEMQSKLRPTMIAVFVVMFFFLFSLMAPVMRRFERATLNVAQAIGRDASMDVLDASATPWHRGQGGHGWQGWIEPVQLRIASAAADMRAWQQHVASHDLMPLPPPLPTTAPHNQAATANVLPGRRLALMAMVSIVAIVAISMGIVAWQAFSQADRALTYELVRKAEGVANTLTATFNHAAELGIPLDKMPGINEKLTELREQHPELYRISVIIAGERTYSSNTPPNKAVEATTLAETLVETAPIRLASGSTELIEVVVDPRFTQHLFNELSIDFLVILIVSVFITLELIYFLTGALIVSPLNMLTVSLSRLATLGLNGSIPARYGGAMRGVALALRERQAELIAQYQSCRNTLRAKIVLVKKSGNGDDRMVVVRQAEALRAIRHRYGLSTNINRTVILDAASALLRVRAPFFLVLMAEDLSRGFLPVFAGQMSVGSIDVPAELLVSLPIFLFMFAAAFTQPLIGAWFERLGRRRSFLLAAGLSVIAHFMTAHAATMAELLAWRSLAGACWAVAFLSSQGMVLDYTDRLTRAKGMASFVTVIMVSLTCGPAIGGLLADGLGQRATLVIASIVALFGFVIAWLTLPHATIRKAPALIDMNNASMTTSIFRNWRFMSLLLVAAFPAKLILAAYCYYLIPLYLTSMGSNAAMAGRVILIYSVLMVLLVPIAAEALTHLRRKNGRAPNSWLVGFGIALSGAGALSLFWPSAIPAAFLLIAILGVAQATSILPQGAMIGEVARREIAQRGEPALYGYYRLVERLGGAMGPVIAAGFLQIFSFTQTFMVIGAIVFCCGITFALINIKREAAS